MSSSIPSPPSSSSSSLFGAIDMGTNSFKLLIVEARPNGQFLPVHRHKDPVVLGRRGGDSDSHFSISDHSQSLALDSLRAFRALLRRHSVAAANTRCVATSAVREAANRSEFLETVKESSGFEVEVLTGEEEARLAYLSSLQFFPFRDEPTLCIDIGGGSTEFAVGLGGAVLFARSLNLGHVSLTQAFQNMDAQDMREYIRSTMTQSGLVEDVKRLGFERVVGSSGTIRALENAAAACGTESDRRDWKLSKAGLRVIAERVVEMGDIELFKGARSEFIVAGAVLLEEIFEAVGIEEMEVSGFSLVEGVVAEALSHHYVSGGGGGYDFGANERWRSAVRLGTRLNGKKRMNEAAKCALIAKEIFEEVTKHNEIGVSLGVKDLEYLEVACLLHNIGHFIGKKGYHKHSHSIIMNGGHLQGYSSEEVKIIALLARHHRKKFPKLDHSSFKELPTEVKKKFKFLCAIIRASIALMQHQNMRVQAVESSHSLEGFDFKSVFRDLEDQSFSFCSLTESEKNDEGDLRQELEYFKKVNNFY